MILLFPFLIPRKDSSRSIFRLSTQASTVSRTDCIIRQGNWKGRTQIPLPNSPGVDFVGILYRVDNDTVTKYKLNKGERVLSLTKWGGNTRYLSVKPDELVKVPQNVDPAEAACLVETYLSIFQSIHLSHGKKLRYKNTSLRGRSILVIGNVEPNVACAIGQLSSVASVESVYAFAKPKHFQKLASHGIIPLSEEPMDWYDRLKGKIDIIVALDCKPLPLFYKVLTATGQVVIATQDERLASDQAAKETTTKILACAIRGKAGNSKSRTHVLDIYSEWVINLQRSKEDLAHLVQLLQKRKITPCILDRIPLSKVAKAQEMMEAKRLPGFIVCEPWLVSKSRAVLL
jgi:NADPH:quinone reductase-like Zn-dependent oxidoreductase